MERKSFFFLSGTYSQVASRGPEKENESNITTFNTWITRHLKEKAGGVLTVPTYTRIKFQIKSFVPQKGWNLRHELTPCCSLAAGRCVCPDSDRRASAGWRAGRGARWVTSGKAAVPRGTLCPSCQRGMQRLKVTSWRDSTRLMNTVYYKRRPFLTSGGSCHEHVGSWRVTK